MARLPAYLEPGAPFPPTHQALEQPNGLLCVGGDLTPETLLRAYARGIFPWYDDGQPILWWTPDPRAVLFPDELHVSRSLRRTLRRDAFHLSADTCFEAVVRACAAPRPDQQGTWIDAAMLAAYTELHRRGHAHAIEVWNNEGDLVGGLYGVAMGGAFFGESMFSRATDASKVALVALVWLMQQYGGELIDCQLENPHLNRLGARLIPRVDFEQRLAHTVHNREAGLSWTLPEHCGALL